jgi:hypothetical protein
MSDESTPEPPKNKGGRPKGIPAWNKDKRLPVKSPLGDITSPEVVLQTKLGPASLFPDKLTKSQKELFQAITHVGYDRWKEEAERNCAIAQRHLIGLMLERCIREVDNLPIGFLVTNLKMMLDAAKQDGPSQVHQHVHVGTTTDDLLKRLTGKTDAPVAKQNNNETAETTHDEHPSVGTEKQQQDSDQTGQ